MAKKIYIKQPDGERIPFLRGILVQSLVQSGIGFEDAYAISQTARKCLRDKEEFTSAELGERVASLLETHIGPEARRSYEANLQEAEREIQVISPERTSPFSVGLLAHSLESCAIDPETARIGARAAYDVIRNSGRTEIHSDTLRRLIYQCLDAHCSHEAARRYLSWRQFRRRGIPLILLIGGITGSGKSTVATELAYRLDIVRTQSTDMMREIIRSMLPHNLFPTLGYSSFEAWRGLTTVEEGVAKPSSKQVVRGFLSQFSAVKIALEAAMARAVKERHSLIIEGIHVIPTRMDLVRYRDQAVIVPIQLAKLGKKSLRGHIQSRSGQQPDRGSKRYLQHMDDIWELQSFLLSEADRANLPIIVNEELGQTVREVMDLVTKRIMELCPPKIPRPLQLGAHGKPMAEEEASPAEESQTA